MSKQSAHLDGLYALIDFLAGALPPEEDKVWGRIAEKLAAALDAEAATYYSYLPAKRQLMPRRALGFASKDLDDTAVDIRTGICGWVAEHGEPALVADAYQDPRFLKEVDRLTGFKTRTVLAVPLRDGLDLTGVLELINKRGSAFSQADLRFVSAACRAAAAVLRAARLEASVERRAARQASLLEGLGGGFLAVDAEGRLILCNPAARRILGLAGHPPLDVPVGQALLGAPEMAEVLTETLRTKKSSSRNVLRRPVDGRERTIGYGTILTRGPAGEISGAAVTFQDITDAQDRQPGEAP